MARLFHKAKKQIAKMERGQVLLLVTLAIVGIVAVVGLALDVGVMFIENARLRRAVDAASLAAALQYREGYTPEELERSALEFLKLNGINDPTAFIQICDESQPDYHSEDLCTDPPRKLVRVRASATAHLAFLPVIGFNEAPMSNEAVGETASVDVVLLIDTSDSMTYDDYAGTYPNRTPQTPLGDPSVCNHDDVINDLIDSGELTGITHDDVNNDGMPGECHPFEEVKQAASSFVQQLYFPFDRVAVVTFDKSAHVNLHFSSDETEIIDAIKNLMVYEGEGECDSGSPCRDYDDLTEKFLGFGCPAFDAPPAGEDPDIRPCGSTNLGDGLKMAGNEFAEPPVRTSALWVTILLSDGAANQGACAPRVDDDGNWHWDVVNCRDTSGLSRHLTGNIAYDADDYAHDMADFVGEGGQNALIFTIGLGDLVQKPDNSDGVVSDNEWIGEKFLEYAAGDGVGDGLYYHAPSGAQLRDIFQAIADNIATRLAQ